MTALRATTYVLTSLASAVFLALTAVGVVRFVELRDSFVPFAPAVRDGVAIDDAGGRDTSGRIVEIDGPRPASSAVGSP